MSEIMEEMTGQLAFVEEGINMLDQHKIVLRENSLKVKNNINHAVDGQMKLLRDREKHLIRQVELASSGDQAVMNRALAQLLQHRGALSATRRMLQRCPPEGRGERGVRNTIVSGVNTMPHQDIASLLSATGKMVLAPPVQVSLEDASLQRSITEFGRVTLPGSLSHDDLMPLEEYGDVEHHVLHKSVGFPSSTVMDIDVRKPYYLAAKLSAPPAQTKENIDQNEDKEDLLKWLNRMNLEDEPKSFEEEQTQDQQNAGMDTEDLNQWLNKAQMTYSAESQPYDTTAELPAEQPLKMEVLDVEDVCQANAPCQRFSECCLSGLCERNARQKLEQTARWQARVVEDKSECCGGSCELKTVKTEAPEENVTSQYNPESVTAYIDQLAASDVSDWLLPAPTATNERDAAYVAANQREDVNMAINERDGVIGEQQPTGKKQKLAHDLSSNTVYDVRSILNSPTRQWLVPKTEEVEEMNPEETGDGFFGKGEDFNSWLLPQTENGNKYQIEYSQSDENKDVDTKEKNMSSKSSSVGLFDDVKSSVGSFVDVAMKESWLLKQSAKELAGNGERISWCSNDAGSDFSVNSSSYSVVNDPVHPGWMYWKN